MIVFGILAVIGILFYIPDANAYDNLPQCKDLQINPDEFVWNSPLMTPKDVDVVHCHASAFGYEGGGRPLFNRGSFHPPKDFKHQKLTWNLLGFVKTYN